VIDFFYKVVDLNVAHQMLATSAAWQVNKLLHSTLTLRAQLIINSLDVNFPKETLRSVLKLANLHWQLLNFDLGATGGCIIQVGGLLHGVHFDSVFELFLGGLDILTVEGGVNRMVVHNWSVQSHQVQTASAVGVLQVRWEEEFENGLQADLGTDVLEGWWALRNLEQENVTLLVGCLGVIRAVQAILNHVLPILSTQALWVFLSDFRLFIAEQLLPSDDGRLKNNVFALRVLLIGNTVDFVNQQHDDGLGGHQVLLDVWVVGGVTVREENIQNLFFRQNFPLLVEHLKVVLLKILVQSVHLLGAQGEVRFHDGDGVGNLN
jgi:hypothetical protein